VKKRLLACLLWTSLALSALLLTQPALLGASPPPPEFPEQEWIKAVYVAPWPYGYDSDEAEDVLDDVAGVGSSYVALVVYVYQDYWYSSEVYLDTAQDAALIDIIEDAHDEDLKVALTIFIWVKDGSWRGEIQPEDVKEWFDSYEECVSHYAELAEDNDVELLVIGSELEELKNCNGEWRKVIKEVREVYDGKISYNTNWWWSDETFEAVLKANWLRGLDLIGISAFFELTDEDDPTFAELVKAWSDDANGRDVVADLEELARRFKRPIVFTEVGYRSVDGANKEPWNYWMTGSPDPQEQADCYEALFGVFCDKPWFKGTLWWVWSTDPGEGGLGDAGYCVKDKPAEDVLADWYEMIP